MVCAQQEARRKTAVSVFVLSALFHFYPRLVLVHPCCWCCAAAPWCCWWRLLRCWYFFCCEYCRPPPSAAPPASSAAGGVRGAGTSPASNAANPPAAGAGAGVASISAIFAPTSPCVTGGGSRVHDL